MSSFYGNGGGGSGGSTTSSSSNVIFVDTLPATGQADTLYVTKTNVFRYINGEFVNLNTLEWGSFTQGG